MKCSLFEELISISQLAGDAAPDLPHLATATLLPISVLRLMYLQVEQLFLAQDLPVCVCYAALHAMCVLLLPEVSQHGAHPPPLPPDIDARHRSYARAAPGPLLQVLCTTSTLALGVNLPAHLVIIKGTYWHRTKVRWGLGFSV